MIGFGEEKRAKDVERGVSSSGRADGVVEAHLLFCAVLETYEAAHHG